MIPDAKRMQALHEMAKVNVAAAIVLGQEAGFTDALVLSALFGVVCGQLHTRHGLTPSSLREAVTAAFTPKAPKS